MTARDVFWRMFASSGQPQAYLAYRECCTIETVEAITTAELQDGSDRDKVERPGREGPQGQPAHT